MKRAQVDEVDRVIIRELSRNSRATYKEIAGVVELTDVAVMKRVKKLERIGVIKKYTVIIDPRALGYEYISFTGINARPEKLFDVVEVLKSRDYVKYLALTGGDHDILAVIWASTREELENIYREIDQIDGVVAVYPMILATTIKDEFYV